MQIIPGATARPNYFDRNPTAAGLIYEAQVGPHGFVARDTYTVPAGKLAFVESAVGYIHRTAAPTSNGLVRALVSKIISGADHPLIIAQLPATKNLPGNETYPHAVGQAGILAEGDQLRIATEDLATGGLVRYYLAATIVEFDA